MREASQGSLPSLAPHLVRVGVVLDQHTLGCTLCGVSCASSDRKTGAYMPVDKLGIRVCTVHNVIHSLGVQVTQGLKVFSFDPLQSISRLARLVTVR